MELEISPDTQLHLQGDITVRIPKFMRTIPRNQMKAVSTAPQRNKMIVACGISEGDLVLLTGDGRLMKINVIEHGLPEEDCLPIDYGHAVLFPQAVTANNTSYEASSWALIDIASPLNVHFGGEPTYEDNAEDPTKDTPDDNP
jgi:hypothetical protein